MAHIHEKIDFTVCVFIVHKNKVLLRMHDKYNMWLPPGGHVELDEDPNQAAVREVKEEVGLDVELWNGNQKSFYTSEQFREIVPPVFMNRHFAHAPHEHVDLVFFAKAETDAVVPETPGEQIIWLAEGDLDSVEMPDNVRVYCKAALETLGEK